ncbi:MAG: alpha/beta hydrolase [Gammaproteobacteria bacterium]|nr:alpha/beta hydrolase [Gammaproteobacteria bacterium]
MTTEARLPLSMQDLTHEVVTADSNGIDYDVWTWRPPGYEQSDQPYPVLFVLDGAMFMGTAIETVSVMSTIGEAKPAILVGVSTAPPGAHGIQRTIDYSAEVPTDEVRAAAPGTEFSFWEIYEKLFEAAGMRFEDGFGGTDAFHAFLTEQILPDITSRYRVDLDEVGVAGHSSGGDFAVDTLLRKQSPISRFIVGSYGTDVLEANLPEREKRFAATAAARPLRVFCGYGGAEEDDPYLTHYIERGVALLQRLQAADPAMDVTIRRFDRETHGSVFAHIFSSGYREIWGTGISFVEAMRGVSIDL